MSTIYTGYRLRIYASDDVTVLTPAGGGDKCLLSTMSGVTDSNGTYKGYLEFPSGRRGKLDPLLKRVDTGEYTARVMDVRLTPGGDNALRWFVKFLGDSGGTEQLKGLIGQWDETRDGGTTWSRWFTGRIQQVENAEPLYFALTFRDTSEELSTIDCFTGDPHASVTYVAREQLLPFGLTQAYGPFQPGIALQNSGKLTGTAITGGIQVSDTSIRDNANIMCSRFVSAASLSTIEIRAENAAFPGENGLKARIKHTSGAHSGSTYNYPVGFFVYREINGDGHGHVDHFGIDVPNIGSSPMPAVGVTVEFTLSSSNRATANTPLFIGDVDPVQMWIDMLKGWFGRLDGSGNPLRTVPYDATAFAALLGKFGVVRYIVADVSNLHDWIEANILPLGLGYRIDAQGQIVPLDLRLPDALAGLPTLTDADLGEAAPQWKTSRDTAYAWFATSYWTEAQVGYSQMQSDSQHFPAMPPGGVLASETPRALPAIGSRILNLQSLIFSGLGLRGSKTESLNGRSRLTAIQAQIDGILNALATRFAVGALEATVPELRVASGDAVEVGSWVLPTFTVLPDPGTGQRGVQRLMQVVEKDPGPLYTALSLIDAGKATTASVPTCGVLAQESGNTLHGVSIPITLDASSDPVRVDGALTAVGVGSAPAATDALWHQLGKLTATGTLNAHLLPSNTRLWVRARSEPSSGYQFPSAWATPATDHINTAAVTAASGLGSAVTGTRVLCTWTVGDATLPVLLYLCTPVGTPTAVLQLPAGSTRYIFENLTASTNYTFGVAHPDGLGGYSVLATANFTTSTAVRTAPAPGGIAILIGITV